jgi:hypothetical protein
MQPNSNDDNNDCAAPQPNRQKEKETIQNIIPFWSENPNILLNNDFLFEFFPVENMSFEQKLNAISRTVVLLSILTFLYTKSIRILFVGAVSLFFIFMLHKSKAVDAKEIKEKKGEGFESADSSSSSSSVPLTPAKQLYKTTDMMNVFQKPESTNPFGNVLVTDYITNPQRKPAPPAFNENINLEIIEQAKEFVRKSNPDQPDITDKLFKDLGDEYVFEQSLRPFTSTASTTIPNDQQSFSEFCYGNMVSCKEGNAFACAKNVARYNN